ncbi:hypothetical protein [Streptomyces prunicolor]
MAAAPVAGACWLFDEPQPSPNGPLTVTVLVFPGVRLLDVTGPIEVFASADEFGGRYRVRVVSEDGAAVIASAGTRIGADLAVDDVLGAVRRRRPPLDADRRVPDDPALPLPPADRLARDGQLLVDGVGVHLVRPHRRQPGQRLRQRRIADRCDGEDGRLRAPAGESGRRRFTSGARPV